jgi:hypothetical protein
MLKSDEARSIENGQVKWLGEAPAVQSARLIVTVLEEKGVEEMEQPVKWCTFPTHMAGKIECWAILLARSCLKRTGNV